MSDEELVEYEESRITSHTEAPLSAATFNDLMLRDELLNAIRLAEFDHPSEVQRQCLPKALLGADILCQARSGTGKTGVFVLATLNQLTDEQIRLRETLILVVVHTRELADQVRTEFVRFGKQLNVSVDAFYGGTDIASDMRRLRNGQPAVVVGTIGRLLELVEARLLHFRHLRHLVVDEVDHLLGRLESRAQLQRIIYRTPVRKQTMFFTATLSPEVRGTCQLFLRNPLEVVTDERRLTLHGLAQRYLKVPEEQKDSRLVEILDSEEVSQCVVFVGGCLRAANLSRRLTLRGFPTTDIHSLVGPEERLRRFQRFRQLKFRILVATDLMARGIDVQDVNLVVNYDMPACAETYLHRVGRAGRFETRGLAVSFVANEADAVVLNDVQMRYGVGVEEYRK